MTLPTQGVNRDPSISEILLSELRSLRTDMNSRLDKLVTTEAFAAEQKRVDEHIFSLGADIADERVARAGAIAAAVAAREVAVTEVKGSVADVRGSIAKTASHIKWLVAAIALPSAGIVTTIWLALRGTA